MRSCILLCVLAGCADSSSRNRPTLDGFLGGAADLAVSDLAGVDLAGVDLASGDLARVDLASGDRTLAADGAGTIAPADTCAAAPTLVPGVEYPDQDTTGLADDYHIGALSNGTCNRNDNVYKEPDAAYAVTVPAGSTLTVQVTPENLPTVWDPALAIVTDCADGSSCLAGHDDSNLTGDPEVVSWTNPGADQRVFVIVDSYYHSGTSNYGYGRYRIVASLQ